LVAQILNRREYNLINNFNLGNYLIIIVIILLLISLLFYLYAKIGIIEESEDTEVFDRSSRLFMQSGESESERNIERGGADIETGIEMNRISILVRSNSSSNDNNEGVGGRILETSERQRESSKRTTSQDSINTRKSNIKGIYLGHAVRCALATIACLIFYQIFFYYYGLSFKYVGSNNELIVLFIQTVVS
jgi:hypothetical protein